MAGKIEIALCMGSSCFARGNNRLLEKLEDLIQTRNWKDMVSLSGLRCQDKCSDGPNIIIDGTLYQAIDEGALLDLLEAKLGADDSPLPRASVRKGAARKEF